METERTILLPRVRRRNVRTRPRTGQCHCGAKWRYIAVVFLLMVSMLCFYRWMRASIPDHVDHDFGVGFDLTASYGTAVISFPNGTTVNVAKIDATESYTKMFRRLSLESSEHIHPPYRDILDEYLRDLPRQAARHALKEAGLPASADVNELSKLIAPLRKAVEAHLGRKISGAVVTVPHLAALYTEDVQDACEYVGLIYIPDYPYWWDSSIFPESGAVYAGNGFGYCENYTNIPSCDEERRHPIHQRPHEVVLSVSYSKTMLTSMLSYESMSFASEGTDNFRNVEMELGWDMRNDNPGKEYYWEAVRQAILNPVLAADRIRMKVEKVMVYGECAMDEEFQIVLEDLIDKTFEKRPEVFQKDPVFVAARGAAEMAKRLVKRPYWPWKPNNIAKALIFGEDY